jgi:hypothetical protein
VEGGSTKMLRGVSPGELHLTGRIVRIFSEERRRDNPVSGKTIRLLIIGGIN